MIHNAVALVVAVAVFWHAAAGCCAHHVHAAEDSAAPLHAHSHSHCGHAHGCSGSATSATADSDTVEFGWHDCSQHEHSICDAGTCDFAAPKSATSGDLDMSAATHLALGSTLLGFAQRPAACLRYFCSELAPASLGASRRHLALSVLQI